MGAVASGIREDFESGLLGYAQVLFSRRPAIGALAAAATFVDVGHGLAGLLGLIASQLAARTLGLDPALRRDGLFALDGLLLGLAMGLLYEPNAAFVYTLMLGGLIVACLSSALRHSFSVYLPGVPVLSLPFLLTAWLLYAAAPRFHELRISLDPIQAGSTLSGVVPQPLEAFAESLAAMFFQVSPASGFMIAVALFAFSRLGFVLGAIGYTSGSLALGWLGISPHDAGGQVLAFNFVLAAIAIGGVFSVPTGAGFAAAGAAGAVTAVVAASSSEILGKLGLPVLAAPFILTTQLALLALRAGGSSRPRLQLADGDRPETNLHELRIRRERFVPKDRLSLPLPVSGRWKITQSFEGPHTHREAWRHGLDFEAVDSEGRTFKGQGRVREDYYAYGLPVHAPLAGRVASVVAHLADNDIGRVDGKHRWGNTVVLWHGANFYSAYSHLARGSVPVEEGMELTSGAQLGRVGSSGRSPVPHLHVQAQAGSSIGAHTVPWTLLHWIEPDAVGAGCEPSGRYYTHGVPDEGQLVEPLMPSARLASALAFPLGCSWTFEVEDPRGRRQEEWHSEIDFSGRMWLCSAPEGARIRVYHDHSILLFEDYEGPHDTALHRLYVGMSRMPFSERKTLRWSDRLDPGPALGSARRILHELALPFRRLARIDVETTLLSRGAGGLCIRTLARPAGALMSRYPERELTLRLDARSGVLAMEERIDGERMFQASLVDSASEDRLTRG
jgi:urea transporter